MKRIVLVALIAAFPFSVMAQKTEDFASKVTDVAVFKDGHALVMTRAEALFDKGCCRTQNVPFPLIGTFWAFVNGAETEIQIVKSGFVEEQTSLPCMSFEDIIQANKGRSAVITESSRATHSGTLL
ncbi:MAG TPA: hypothetical protein PKH07_13155, partial [bacterium]|nr:hypothetical protein [bacterium]